jgi:hypothetical protein
VSHAGFLPGDLIVSEVDEIQHFPRESSWAGLPETFFLPKDALALVIVARKHVTSAGRLWHMLQLSNPQRFVWVEGPWGWKLVSRPEQNVSS